MLFPAETVAGPVFVTATSARSAGIKAIAEIAPGEPEVRFHETVVVPASPGLVLPPPKMYVALGSFRFQRCVCPGPAVSPEPSLLKAITASNTTSPALLVTMVETMGGDAPEILAWLLARTGVV